MRHRALLLFGTCLVATAQAEPMRCAGSFVDEGDSTQALVARCGSPADVTDIPAVVDTQTYVDSNTGRLYTTQTVVRPAYQVWYYNFGPNRLSVSITVVNGTVNQIRKGGYGN
jgi:hypothetical protein